MNVAWLALGGSLLVQMPDASAADAKQVLQPYYARRAAAYEVFRDADHKERLELRLQPVLTWTNADNFMGSVFVWTYRGCPELIGCVGSRQASAGECFVFQELHSLSLATASGSGILLSLGSNGANWKALRHPPIRSDSG